MDSVCVRSHICVIYIYLSHWCVVRSMAGEALMSSVIYVFLWRERERCVCIPARWGFQGSYWFIVGIGEVTHWIAPTLRPCAEALAYRISSCSAEYMEPFETRDLHAFSAEPLLVYPTHYTGDPGYVSDTETSVVWDNETVKTDWDRAKSRKTQEQGELSFQAQNSDVLQSELENWSARDELWASSASGS